MSARADTWMPLYIGDYLADTMHLSGAEHGAYLLLIMHYWRNGPLPNDQRLLASIARTERKVWDKEVGPVVRRFFELRNNTTLHHKRIDQEIGNAEATIEQRSSAGRTAGRASAARRAIQRSANDRSTIDATASNDRSTIVAVPEQRSSTPSPSPSPSQEGIERDTSLRSVVPRRGTDDADFDRFWVVYPRKDAKIDAQKAWKAARKLASAEEIIGGLERYPFEAETRLQKLPAGWLREGRWQRELDTRPVTVALPRQSGRAEDLVTDYGLDLSTPIDEQFPLEEREREREYAASGRGRLAYEVGTGDGGR